MCRDELVRSEKMITGKNNAGSVIVGFIFIILLTALILTPAVGKSLKNEIKRTAGERAYIADLQAILELHDIRDAEIKINEDVYRSPNIRYCNVTVSSMEFEDLDSDEIEKILLELKEVKLKPSEDEVFIVITRPFLESNCIVIE